MAPFPLPLSVHAETVGPEWIDANGHMNVAFYAVSFDRASFALFGALGLDDAWRREHGGAFFALEQHLCFRHEVRLADRVTFSTRLLAADDRKLRFFHQMLLPDCVLAATSETLVAYVDLATRRGVCMPGSLRERVHSAVDAHRALPWPKEAGRSIQRPG